MKLIKIVTFFCLLLPVLTSASMPEATYYFPAPWLDNVFEWNENDLKLFRELKVKTISIYDGDEETGKVFLNQQGRIVRQEYYESKRRKRIVYAQFLYQYSEAGHVTSRRIYYEDKLSRVDSLSYDSIGRIVFAYSYEFHLSGGKIRREGLDCTLYRCHLISWRNL